MEEGGDIFHFSWLNKEYCGGICISKVRDQTTVGVGSCAHHAVGAVLEMLHWRKLQEEGRGDERKDLDVGDMYDRYTNYRLSAGLRAQSSTKSLLEWLKDNDARAEGNGNEVFKLKGFEDLKPLDKVGSTALLLQKLFSNGPFVGVFAIKKDHISNGGLYLCDGEPVTYSTTTCDVERPLRHAVAVVGFGIDRNFHPFWEYLESVSHPDRNFHPFWEHLESVSPDDYTSQGRGFHRVFVTGIDRAFLLDV